MYRKYRGRAAGDAERPPVRRRERPARYFRGGTGSQPGSLYRMPRHALRRAVLPSFSVKVAGVLGLT
jgi:hypothetical protein